MLKGSIAYEKGNVCQACAVPDRGTVSDGNDADAAETGAGTFYVLEETRVNGVNYLLVSEQDSLDAECYILKDVSSQESAEAAYEFVEDDDELDSVFKIFQELVDDEEV